MDEATPFFGESQEMHSTFLFFLFEIVYDIEPLLKSESRRQKNLFLSFGYCLEGGNHF